MWEMCAEKPAFRENGCPFDWFADRQSRDAIRSGSRLNAKLLSTGSPPAERKMAGIEKTTAAGAAVVFLESHHR